MELGQGKMGEGGGFLRTVARNMRLKSNASLLSMIFEAVGDTPMISVT